MAPATFSEPHIVWHEVQLTPYSREYDGTADAGGVNSTNDIATQAANASARRKTFAMWRSSPRSGRNGRCQALHRVRHPRGLGWSHWPCAIIRALQRPG